MWETLAVSYQHVQQWSVDIKGTFKESFSPLKILSERFSTWYNLCDIGTVTVLYDLVE